MAALLYNLTKKNVKFCYRSIVNKIVNYFFVLKFWKISIIFAVIIFKKFSLGRKFVLTTNHPLIRILIFVL